MIWLVIRGLAVGVAVGFVGTLTIAAASLVRAARSARERDRRRIDR